MEGAADADPTLAETRRQKLGLEVGKFLALTPKTAVRPNLASKEEAVLKCSGLEASLPTIMQRLSANEMQIRRWIDLCAETLTATGTQDMELALGRKPTLTQKIATRLMWS